MPLLLGAVGSSKVAAGGGGTPEVVNSAVGTASTASVTATFGFTATAGNTLILCVGADDYDTGIPSGWSQPTGGAQEGYMGMYFWYKTAAGGETSAQYQIGSATGSAWLVAEISHLGTVNTSAGGIDTASVGYYTTPPITPTTGSRAVFGLIGGSTNGTFSGMQDWTNSYVEIGDSYHAIGASHDCIGLAWRLVTGDGSTAYSTTGYFSGSISADQGSRIAVAFAVS